jgi:hypothetical protein
MVSVRLEVLGFDGRIILKWLIKLYEARVNLIWLRIGARSGLL